MFFFEIKALFHHPYFWLFLRRPNIPTSSSVSKPNSSPNQRILNTKILAGLLRYCITGRLGLWRPWLVLSPVRETSESQSHVKIVSQNPAAEASCASCLNIFIPGPLSTVPVPSPVAERWSDQAALTLQNPGIVNSMVIWSVRLLQIFSSWEVQTSTQPVQKPLTLLKANCFLEILHRGEIAKQKLVLTGNLQPDMLSNCWSQWGLCNTVSFWFQGKFLLVYISFLLRQRLYKLYP